MYKKIIIYGQSCKIDIYANSTTINIISKLHL